VQWRHFAVARLARLDPVYEITLLVFVALAALAGADRELMTFSNLAANVLMLQVWLPVPGWDSINLPAWSLSVEAFLYVALFPLLVAVRRLPWARVCFAALIVAGALWGVCFYNYDRGALFRFWPLPLLCGAGGFAAGFAVRELLTDRPLRRPGVAALAALGLISAGILNRVIFPASESHGYMALGFIGLVATSTDPTSAIYRALARPALLYLGDISYSLYLWHFCVMMLLVRVGAHLDNHLHSSAQHAVYAIVLACSVVIASFLVATASYRWIEVPFRRLIRDRFVRASPGLKTT
jgi:peptidoglycan/LPS O-acetylase OafA/YrhL